MKYSQLLSFAILLISVSSVLQWCSLPIGNTFIWWCVYAGILLCFFKLKPRGYTIWPINLFLIYLCFSAIYGAVFMAENYWDWKLLINNILIFLLSIAAYTYSIPILLTKTLRLWFKFAWIILIILTPFLSSDAWGRFLVPYAFLALFLPLLNKKYRILVLLAYMVTITLGIDNRSDIIKFSVSILLGVYCSWKWIQGYLYRFYGIIYILLLASPLIFLILGITGIFNIFQIEKELGLEDKFTMETSSENEISALVDTRTFIYAEEIYSAIKHNYVIQGHSIARGYESKAFQGIDKDLGLNRGERASSEVSIMNIFNYMGIIGVVIYFLIFASSSYKALFQSNNIYIPILGIYILFRWSYAWIEDFTRFDLNYLFLWIMIGICFSPHFRTMNNIEMKIWLKSIMTKKVWAK